jgi:hypothetical protein
MVPVYARRFLLAGRGTFGHPVLSRRGRDIIYYGTDLIDYIGRSSKNRAPNGPPSGSHVQLSSSGGNTLPTPESRPTQVPEPKHLDRLIGPCPRPATVGVRRFRWAPFWSMQLACN